MKVMSKRAYNFTITVAILFFLVFSATAVISIFEKHIAYAQENQEILIDGYDFSDNSVIVTMDKNVGGVNKIHNKSYFGNIAVTDVTDLTYRKNVANVDLDNFKQILKLELKYHDKNYVLQAVEKISKIKGVETVSPNYFGEFCATANDSLYDLQWGLKGHYGSIDIEPAWDITSGSKAVRVGVIDTGIAQHPDLIDNLAPGWNFVDNNSDTNDTWGHGTHVAGIIGAVGDNDIGISGVCKEVELVPLKISNNFSWSTENVILAITYADNLWGTADQIDLLNFSGGGTEYNENVYNAINTFRGLFVTIAGNGEEDRYGNRYGYDIDNRKYYPACYSCDNIITVGSINNLGYRSLFSNYGKKSVDIYAPGENILSTFPSAMCATGNCYAVEHGEHFAEGYHYMSGTSMAAPHVTGVAALLLSRKPNLTAAELKKAILENADDISTTLPDGKKLNAYKAVESLGKKYTVSLHFPSIAGGDATDKVSVAYGEMMPLPYNDWIYAPQRTGYVFVGYYSEENGNGTQYYSMEVTRNDAAVDLGDLYYERLVPIKAWDHFKDGDLYADWELMECDYSYTNIKAGDGFFDEESTVHLVYGEKTTITAKTFDGYKFAYFQRYDNNKKYTESTVEWDDILLVRNGASGLIRPKNGFAAVYEKNCVAEGTLITLADGEQVPVEQLTGNESLLVWNLFTGTFDTAPILCIDRDSLGTYEVINLYFSDDTQVKVISEHGFWDFDLNKYVYLDKNASEYIGHWFNKQITDDTGNFAWGKVQLTDVIIQEEYTTAWSPVTYSHLCYYVNGMLSMPGGIDGLFNIFDVDIETMSYDKEAMAADIEQYGLFTYEEFAEILPVPEEVFEAVNGQYLKVAIGKGLIDLNTIASYINQYSRLFG